MLYTCKFPVDVPMYNLPPCHITVSGSWFYQCTISHRLPWTVKESILSLKDDNTARGSMKGAILTRQMS